MQRVPQGTLTQGRGRLRQAVLAREGPERHRRIAERPGQRHVRRLARPTARPGVLFGFVGGDEARAASEGCRRPSGAPRVLKNFAELLRCRRPCGRATYFETDWPSEQVERAAGPVGIARARRAAGARPGAAPAGRPHPLGRHRDVDLLERLHGRRHPLGRAGGQGGARRCEARAPRRARAARLGARGGARAPAPSARASTPACSRASRPRASRRWPTSTPTAASTRAPT